MLLSNNSTINNEDNKNNITQVENYLEKKVKPIIVQIVNSLISEKPNEPVNKNNINIDGLFNRVHNEI